MLKRKLSWYELSSLEQEEYFRLFTDYDKVSDSINKWENLASEPIGFNGGIFTVVILILQNVKKYRKKKKLENFLSTILRNYKRNEIDKDFPYKEVEM